MAKIKKVLEINNEIDEIIKKVNCLNLKKSELMNERELILKSKDVEKSTMDSLKYKIKLYKNMRELAIAQRNICDNLVSISFIRHNICNHEIIQIIDENVDGSVYTFCPICGAEMVQELNEFKYTSNVINCSKDEDKNKYFGDYREIGLELIARMNRFQSKNEESTIDDFFGILVEENPSKCKRKMR